VAQRTVRIRSAVLVWRDGEVLLVRHEKGGRSYWLVPGGGVDPGETMVDAGVRELREETGYDVEVGRLVLLCEAIDPEPGGRHIVNAVYSGTVRGGAISVGVDKALRDAKWLPVDELTTLEMYPPVGAELRAVIEENGEAAVRVLGNTWRAWGERDGT
jgi:ADP-ribose pyrophosphatase YjhB (NUDIX family)